MNPEAVPRYVLDTNVLVSRLLLPRSLPAQATDVAIRQGNLLFSEATLDELNQVLSRPKLNRYLNREERLEFFRLLSRLSVVVDITHPVQACRDPKDDRILEVAVNGEAHAIITGDADLAALHPFRGIPVMSPREFLDV